MDNQTIAIIVTAGSTFAATFTTQWFLSRKDKLTLQMQAKRDQDDRDLKELQIRQDLADRTAQSAARVEARANEIAAGLQATLTRAAVERKANTQEIVTLVGDVGERADAAHDAANHISQKIADVGLKLANGNMLDEPIKP